MCTLNTFLDGRLAGRLTMSISGAVEFSYDDEYHHHPQATPLSLSMPLARSEHRETGIPGGDRTLVPGGSPAQARPLPR